MSTPGPSARRSTRPAATAATAKLAATAAVTAPTSSPPDQTAAVPSSDDSVGYEPTAEEDQADAADEAKEDREHGAARFSQRQRLNVSDPRSITPAHLHDFFERSITLPMSDPNWCNPVGGRIKPAGPNGQPSQAQVELNDLILYRIFKRMGGTDSEIARESDKAAVAALDAHPGDWFPIFCHRGALWFDPKEMPTKAQVDIVLREILPWLKRIKHESAGDCEKLLGTNWDVPTTDGGKQLPKVLSKILFATPLVCSDVHSDARPVKQSQIDLSPTRAAQVGRLALGQEPYRTFRVCYKEAANLSLRGVLLAVVAQDRIPLVLAKEWATNKPKFGSVIPIPTKKHAFDTLAQAGPEGVKARIAAWVGAGHVGDLLVDLDVAHETFAQFCE